MDSVLPILGSSVAAAILTAVISHFREASKMNSLVSRLEERLEGAVCRLEDLFRSNYNFLLFRIEALEEAQKNSKK